MTSDREPHDMLDDVAVYALGALPAADAERVREHMRTCEECRQEYEALRATAALVGSSAQNEQDAATCPSGLLKPRIMRLVRETAIPPSVAAPAGAPAVTARTRPAFAWGSYVAVAACLVLALISITWSVSATRQTRALEAQLAASMQRTAVLEHEVAAQRATLADLTNGQARRYVAARGEAIASGDRLYLALHGLPPLPRGKVYQAWTLRKGSKSMTPEPTFVATANGTAFMTIPKNARSLAAVAVSIEPSGGSAAPTSKPVFLVPLG